MLALTSCWKNVKLSLILDTITLMWRQCNTKYTYRFTISSVTKIHSLLCCGLLLFVDVSVGFTHTFLKNFFIGAEATIDPMPIKHHWKTWWRHQMETFSALLALCAGNSPVTGEFPAQRPVTRSFDVFFDLHLYEPLSKHSWGWWFETPSYPIWRHCNYVGK